MKPRRGGRRLRRLPLKVIQLLFFGAIVLAISVLTLYTLVSTYRSMAVFETSLTRYFDIQRLRAELETNRSLLDRYLRERNSEDLAAYRRSVGDLYAAYRRVHRTALTGQASRFEINAIEAGIDAFLMHAENAIEAMEQGAEDFFVPVLRAHRIAFFIQSYIENLMQIRLAEDATTFTVLQAQTRTMRTTSLIAIAAIGALFALVIAVFSRTITSPIRRLAHASQLMAEGRLDIDEIEAGAVDEVATLAVSFNRMNRNIRELVLNLKDQAQLERKLHDEELKNVQMERSLQEAQLLGLQSQINPHFLFNALNTIARVSMFERGEKTTRLIQSLSDLFRYHLRNPATVVRLSEELDLVRQYIHIQEYRFGSRLTFELNCDPSASDATVPSFVIQPLVENSIKYGIEPLEEGGTVRVDVNRRNGSIQIRVQDTGVGMEKNRLAQVTSAANQDNPDETAGIGLANVVHRLRLLYHNRARFSIESAPGRGTVVEIDIPAAPVTPQPPAQDTADREP